MTEAACYRGGGADWIRKNRGFAAEPRSIESGAEGWLGSNPDRVVPFSPQLRFYEPRLLMSETLTVKVISATNLAVGDKLTGTSDPYVVVKYAGRKNHTKTKDKTLDPVWNEEMHFPYFEGRDMVFRVWDKDFGPGSDDFLGKVTVGADVLKELKDGETWGPKELGLGPSKKHKDVKVRGTLKVAITKKKL